MSVIGVVRVNVTASVAVGSDAGRPRWLDSTPCCVLTPEPGVERAPTSATTDTAPEDASTAAELPLQSAPPVVSQVPRATSDPYGALIDDGALAGFGFPFAIAGDAVAMRMPNDAMTTAVRRMMPPEARGDSITGSTIERPGWMTFVFRVIQVGRLVRLFS